MQNDDKPIITMDQDELNDTFDRIAEPLTRRALAAARAGAFAGHPESQERRPAPVTDVDAYIGPRVDGHPLDYADQAMESYFELFGK